MRKLIFVLAMIALSSGLMSGLPAQAGQEGLLMAAKTTSLYDFTMDDIDGKPVNLSAYKGKVLLLVNTASLCGNTPQYSDLERVYEQFHEQGFEVLAFPANNFGQQEPGTNAEIKGFCLTKYSVSFPLFSKISVKGSDKHPLYQYLTEQSAFPGEVEWNFQKYLINEKGELIDVLSPRVLPTDQVIIDFATRK